MELVDVFENRRSVSFFDKDKELSDAILENIIDLAVLAPSAFNLQPWRLIAVKSKEAKERLYKNSFNQIKILEAPVTLVVIGDKEGYREENSEWEVIKRLNNGDAEKVRKSQAFAKKQYGSDDIAKTKFAESNAALFAMSIMYAAKNFNVDSHPMSGIDFQGIASEFELSEHETPVMLISLGYFDSSKVLYARRERRKYKEIVSVI